MARFPVGDGVAGAAVDTHTHRVFVVDTGNSLAVLALRSPVGYASTYGALIDLQSLRQIGRFVQIGTAGYDVQASARTGRMFLIDHDSNTIKPVDAGAQMPCLLVCG